MKLQELQSKIAEITFGKNPHSPLNSKDLDNLFADKRRLLSEKEYGVVKIPKLNCGHNKYA